MNNTQIYIENIGIGLANISNLQKLDLQFNEYLVVGQRNNNSINIIDNEYNLIVNNNGIGINATRREMRDTNAGLLINNNIICKGSIVAKNLEIENFSFGNDITSEKLETLIKSVNSNLLFFKGINDNIVKNIYTPYYVTIGNFSSTYSNSHPLKISDSPNGKSENLQLGIYNNINNDNEAVRFGLGMMGFNQYSPANITTTEGMPLEFHISKSSSLIDDIYSNGTGLPEYNGSNNYPNLAIDINGCININKDKCSTTIIHNNKIINPILNVNGYGIINNLFVYDYYTNCNLHLDDIYLRKNGLTLKANQIIGGDFNKDEFTFNSNVYIGQSNNFYLLSVNGSTNITNTLTTNNLIAYNTNINGIANFNKTTYFNNITIFNDNITIDKSLNINNDLFINGYRINTCNVDYANNGLNYDYGCNLNISGRLGTGILNTDTYDHQFNIIKRNKERFELYIQDISGITNDSSKVYIGHTNLNNINGTVDNSFIIFTQKNIKWHNIYFYAGKDKDGTKGIKNLIPNLSIMENNRIGINTNLPQKTLDIIGDIITNDYYIKKNNKEYKLNYIYFDINGFSILNVDKLNINLNTNINYLNKKTLNLTGGINSYDGYFENNNKLATFKIYNSIATTFNNIGIGIVDTNNNYLIPLQVRNTNTTINNNTIIRLYRGVKGGGFNNNSLYTGIDFCDYDMPIKTQNRNNYKWFIYKNNITNNENIGPLQIGYTDNSYNPTHSCMNFYYSSTYKKYFIDINNPNINYNYNPNNSVAIKGNVEIEGNINLKGDNVSYMINGAIIGSFSNPAILKNISSSTNSYYTDNINDISLLGNKLIFLPKKTTIIGYSDDWIFSKINTLDIFNNNSPLFIYNNKDYADDNNPPIITRFYNKAYKNYTSRPDIAIIELGILSDTSDDGIINNKINFKVKGYTDNLTIFEINPNNNNPFLTCISHNTKNQVNIGNGLFYTSNLINNDDTCLHIYDDFDCLLRLTNETKPVKISLINNNNKWDINASSNFILNYNNYSILDLTSNGILTLNNYNFNKNNNSSFNINSIVNKPALELTNYYYNDYQNPIILFNNNGWINIEFNKITTEIINYHDDNYDDNFDNNITKFIYKIDDINLPSQDINNCNINNYYINNCNFTLNSNIILDIKTSIYNIEVDYKYLDNINIYTTSNCIELIPTLKTYNPNLIANFKTFNILSIPYNIDNIELNLNYKIPHTVDDEQLYIDSSIIDIDYYSNFDINNYYNLSLNTFLKVKDKPLFDYNIKSINSVFIVNYNNSNYHYNTTNYIYYYPLPNINVREIEIDIKYLYNYQNSITLPNNFYSSNNFNNIIDILSINSNYITLNNSNSYLLPYIYGNNINNQIDAYNFIKPKLISSNTINKIYPIEINNVNITDIIINITKNDYFDVYDFNNNNPNIPIPITINQYEPHLILKNYTNSKFSSLHKFFSYDNKYEIHLDNNKLISLNSNGDINTNGSIYLNDIFFSGDIYSKIGDNSVSITSNLTHIIGSNFYIHKTNISLNSSNIFLNPSVINKGGIIINGSDIHNNNNLFQINNYIDNDNFITLKSISSSGYINFFNTTNIYKFGVNDGNFGIWKSLDNSILNNDFLENNLNYYSNVINFNYNNDNKLNIDINGNIKTTNNFSINNITTYINDNLDYKLRVYGNLKVDGVVMSSSDKRIKKDINKIENALDKIEKLSGVFYYYNNNHDNHRQMGLIAQDVKEVIPEVVYEDENGFLNIAYGNLMGVVIEAIKELRNEIKNNK